MGCKPRESRGQQPVLSMRFCGARRRALVQSGFRPVPALARGQDATTIGIYAPAARLSHGSPSHARRFPLDAVEERRRAHDRDRRVSAGATLDTFSVAGKSRRRRTRRPVLAFPGIDRTSCCWTGAGMRLHDGGSIRRADHALRAAACSAATRRSTARWSRDPCATSTLMFRRGSRARDVTVARGEAAPSRRAVPLVLRGNGSARVPAARAGADLGSRGPSAAGRREDRSRSCNSRPIAAGCRGVAAASTALPCAAIERARGFFAADALTSRRMGARRAIDIAADGTIASVRRQARSATMRNARAVRSSRHAEPALARIPARHGRAHRAAGAGRRQLLDVAAGDVRVPRAPRRRRVRGDRRAGVRRDAEGGLHGGRRIPLRAPRSAGQPYADPAEIARRVVAAAATPGIGAHAAAGVLRARRFRRQRRRPPAQRRSCTRSMRSRGSSSARAAMPRTADCSLGVAPHSLRAVTPDELGRRRRAGAARAPIHIHAAEQTREVEDCVAGSARGRSSGCSTHAPSTRAGASSTRRT